MLSSSAGPAAAWLSGVVPLVHGSRRTSLPLPARGGALDLDAAPLRLLRERDRDLQDAVVEVGLHAVRIDSLRQRDHPREAPVGPLGAVDASLFLRLHLRTPLTFDRQRVVRDLDADVI